MPETVRGRPQDAERLRVNEFLDVLSATAARTGIGRTDFPDLLAGLKEKIHSRSRVYMRGYSPTAQLLWVAINAASTLKDGRETTVHFEPALIGAVSSLFDLGDSAFANHPSRFYQSEIAYREDHILETYRSRAFGLALQFGRYNADQFPYLRRDPEGNAYCVLTISRDDPAPTSGV